MPTKQNIRSTDVSIHFGQSFPAIYESAFPDKQVVEIYFN